MDKTELFNARGWPRDVGIFKSIGVLPEMFDAAYFSWGLAQHGEGGTTQEGVLYLVSGGHLIEFVAKRVGLTESADQHVLPASPINGIGRRWISRRGFDESDVLTLVDEYSLTLHVDGRGDIRFPIRDFDYGGLLEASRQAEKLGRALQEGL